MRNVSTSVRANLVIRQRSGESASFSSNRNRPLECRERTVFFVRVKHASFTGTSHVRAYRVSPYSRVSNVRTYER